MDRMAQHTRQPEILRELFGALGNDPFVIANSVNASNVAVGSVDAGTLQRGVIYSGGSATIITQTKANGSFFVTAFGINDSGRMVGQGMIR